MRNKNYECSVVWQLLYEYRGVPKILRSDFLYLHKRKVRRTPFDLKCFIVYVALKN